MAIDKHWAVVAWVLLAFVSVLGTVAGQGITGTISGTVHDETGAVLPGVTVVVTNTDTGISRTLLTGEEGTFKATSLSPGNYTVRAELAGFRTEIREGIKITVGREAVVPLTLKIGEISEQVVVSGEASLVETTGSTLSGLVDDKKIRDLPLNGRDMLQLAQLQLGVIVTRNAGADGDRGYSMKISVAGSRPYANSFLLDGTDANESQNRSPGSIAGVMLGVETVREFRVLTHNYTAEHGRASGGVVNAVTKSGTNELHGSLFEFHRNSALDARNFFDTDPSRPQVRSDPPSFKRNQFGGTVGGPIIKNRTFFFAGYEGLRDRLGLTRRAKVPTPAAREGRIPGRPAVTVNPAVRPFLDLWPLPNGLDFGDGTAEDTFSASQRTNEDYFAGRIDHAFSEEDSLFGRFTIDDGDRFSPIDNRFLFDLETSRNIYFTLGETHVFSSSLLNEFRFGFNRSGITYTRQSTKDIGSLSFIPGQPMGQASVPGLLTLWAEGVPHDVDKTFLNVFDYVDNLSYTRGRHSLKTGILVKRFRFNIQNPTRTGGRFAFDSFTDFLLGTPRRVEAFTPGSDINRGFRYFLIGTFVQDDLKLTPRLTLNLGVRYEFITVPTEVNGKISNIIDPLRDAQLQVGDPWMKNPSLRNIDPRLGLAWDLFGDGKTALRAGFGIFSEQFLPLWFSTSGIRMPPFFNTAQIDRPPFPLLPVERVTGARKQLWTHEYNLKSPKLLRYNVNIQREMLPSTVVTLGYAGSRGLHQATVMDFNIPIPEIQAGDRPFFAAGLRRRNPNWETIDLISSNTDSFYNSLLIGVDRRFYKGFQTQLSYTHSRLVDESNGPNTASDTAADSGNQRFYDRPEWNRSLSTYDARHNLTLNATWDLPFGPGRRWASSASGAAAHLVGRWQLNSITTLATGSPVNINMSGNRSRDLDGSDRPDLAPGASNNPVLGGAVRYFDGSVFLAPPAGYYGNLGRNTLIGPGFATLDLSLIKNFQISEEVNLSFRSEFFNVTNRVNFGIPARTVLDGQGRPIASAGRIDRTRSTARQIQFGLKLTF
ncbi:MAG: TonB-dependent receptor [Acidobacteria bacterium]|nr:TonB-dependent receptor [Acidobacteriota bacterium]